MNTHAYPSAKSAPTSSKDVILFIDRSSVSRPIRIWNWDALVKLFFSVLSTARDSEIANIELGSKYRG
jgi:hypothetical protein